jgi:hypothetical protein
MHLNKGNRWKGKGGMGRVRGGSVYYQPGTRVDSNSRHDTKEGFPSKYERDFQTNKGGISKW